MLRKITLENFSSINAKQELNLAVDRKQADLHGWAMPATEEDREELPDIATLAVIYGANGAGKTSILQGINALSLIAYQSQTTLKADEDLPAPSWFDQKAPTKMGAEFLTPEGKEVRYEISFTRQFILSETLTIHQKEIFQRGENNIISSCSEELKTLPVRNLRRNASFLSFAASYDQLKDIHSLFNFGFHTFDNIKRNSVPKGDIPHLEKAFALISDLDLGISRLSFQEIPGKEKFNVIFADHKLPNGEIKKLPFQAESDGTAHLLGISLHLQAILEEGTVLLMDEIEEKIHPLAVFRLLELFNNPETNPKKAQLICTSHLPDIMDEIAAYNIFLTEKRHQSTRLWRLDQDENFDGERNSRASYLQKIYGGVPRIGMPASREN